MELGHEPIILAIEQLEALTTCPQRVAGYSGRWITGIHQHVVEFAAFPAPDEAARVKLSAKLAVADAPYRNASGGTGKGSAHV